MAHDDFDDPLSQRLGPVTVRELAELERQYREMRIPEALDDPGMRLADEAKRAAQGLLDVTRLYAPFGAAELQRTAADELHDLNARLTGPAFAGVDETLRASEALRESTADRLVRELQGTLRDLSIGPAGETLGDLFEQANQTHEAALREATQGALAQTLDSVFEAHGLSSWADEIAQAAQSPAWADGASALFDSIEQQTRLVEELLREPSWSDLAEMAARGDVPEPAGPHKDAPRRRLGLVRQFVKACRRIGRAAYDELSRDAKRAEFWRWAFTIAIISQPNQTESPRLEVIRYQSERPPAKRDATERTWTLVEGRTLTLYAQPLHHALDRVRLEGEAKIIERRPWEGWIKVHAWECDGREYEGWIRTQDTEDLVPGDHEICRPSDVPPVLVVDAGPPAVHAWHSFFDAEIDNDHTRQAYRRACQGFLDHCHTDGLALADISPAHVTEWRDALSVDKSGSTVRQSLTAVRRLFDTFVIHQVLPTNPVHRIRPPRLTRSQAVTPSLRPAELIALFERFDPDKLPELRDRALMAVMAFSLARAGAVAALQVGDVDLTGHEPRIRLPEKRGRDHPLPLDPGVAGWIRDYVDAARIEDSADTPLFRSFGRGRGHECVTGNGLSRQDIYALVRKRFEQAGIEARGGCHVLRATGIALQLARGVPIDLVSRLAGHASIDMTRRYEQRNPADMRQALRRLSV